MNLPRKLRKIVKTEKPARAWVFPLLMAGLYLFCFFFSSENTTEALYKSGAIFRQLAGPLVLAFAMMVLLNRFLSPAVAVKYLGRQTGLWGVLFSSLAGIVSMGPVYAWYPLLASVKEKGVSIFHIANFMACRSIKPVLLPVLLAYFGWLYTTTFLMINLVSAPLVAGAVFLVLDQFEGRDNR